MGKKKLSDLTLDQHNANQGTKVGREVLGVSLEELGLGRSILLDKNDQVIAGNKTLEAARAQGIEEVQVVESDGSKLVAVKRTDLDLNNGGKARRLAYADNRTAELNLSWDDGLMLEQLDDGLDLSPFWSDEEIELLRGPGEVIEDLFQEDPPEKPITKPGDLYDVGRHRLICADATIPAQIARLLGGHKPGIMVTDPPYGVKYEPGWRVKYDGHKRKSLGKVVNDDRTVWSDAYRLFPGSVAYVWHSAIRAWEFDKNLTDLGFDIRAEIIWKKHHFVFGRGHYHWEHEPCFYAVRKGQSALWIGGRKQRTVWEIESRSGDLDNTRHSAQKPVECMARPMRNHDCKQVFDPFVGSGTTMIAAEQLDRICFAAEIDPGYCDLAIRRFAQFRGEDPDKYFKVVQHG